MRKCAYFQSFFYYSFSRLLTHFLKCVPHTLRTHTNKNTHTGQNPSILLQSGTLHSKQCYSLSKWCFVSNDTHKPSHEDIYSIWTSWTLTCSMENTMMNGQHFFIHQNDSGLSFVQYYLLEYCFVLITHTYTVTTVFYVLYIFPQKQCRQCTSQPVVDSNGVHLLEYCT